MRKKLYFIVGTNASGKSAIARYLSQPIDAAAGPFNLFITIGEYKNGIITGGCDNIGSNEKIYKLLEENWRREEHIVMEGLLICTRPWLERLETLNKNNDRDIHIISLNTSLETCFKRIESRGGKKMEELTNNGENVSSKWRQVKRFVEYAKRNKPHFFFKELDSEHKPINLVCAELLNTLTRF